jgi:hypothetical protein
LEVSLGDVGKCILKNKQTIKEKQRKKVDLSGPKGLPAKKNLADSAQARQGLESSPGKRK